MIFFIYRKYYIGYIGDSVRVIEMTMDEVDDMKRRLKWRRERALLGV